MKLDPERIDEGGGIKETLKRNKAQYHQICCAMFNNTKLGKVRTTKGKQRMFSQWNARPSLVKLPKKIILLL